MNLAALALSAGAYYAVGHLSFGVDHNGASDPIAAAKLQLAAQIVASLIVYRVASR